MKKLIFGVILFLTFIGGVYANEISNMNMDIFIDNQGNALVTETWNAYVTSGTEGWHPYYNLGNSVISDVSASMDGKDFETVDDWDVNSSLSEKANKASLYYPSSDEVDVVFGITSYGNHVYTIKYTISNFVSTTSDADIIYWNLFPKDFSANPSNVSIVIRSDFEFSDTLDVWGYGKYGAPCYVYDGRIEMTSDGSLSSSEYLTILVKFDKGTFETSNVLDNDFDYYYDMAQDGSTTYSGTKTSLLSKIFVFIRAILLPVLGFAVLVFIIVCANAKNVRYRYGTRGNRVRKDVPNFRDIPCNKDIYRAYWVGLQYKIFSKKENIFGSILLKWVKNGNVSIKKVEKKGIFKNKTEVNIIFINTPGNTNYYESELYNWMYTASKDGILENDEFIKWCEDNYTKIFDWFDSLSTYEERMLINEGKIKEVYEQKNKFLTYHYYDVDDSMMDEAEQLMGLKNFLKDFTLINTREPIEVNLWDEYLMYAQIFGIADEVAKQFKKLYPEIVQNMDSMGFDYDDIILINMMSASGIQSASTARSRAESYSSGGGGFSSGGGGGGSFGGGGGGGGFR